jgi:hypothetical protein
MSVPLENAERRAGETARRFFWSTPYRAIERQLAVRSNGRRGLI